MDLDVEQGKYVVAVSGGVDSMVLLDVLAKKSGVELVVAHFDHGTREDSGEDMEFVKAKAAEYGLKFVGDKGELGASASEETARKARYSFLRKVSEKEKAKAIITAHHQDDVVETAIINIIRGTRRRGLSSLRSTEEIMRPLLKYSKREILDYARSQGLSWREDPTNLDTRYLRNYIRSVVMPGLGTSQRQKLLTIIGKSASSNEEIDRLLRKLRKNAHTIDRKWFVNLPHDAAKEIIGDWLRVHQIPFDAATLERLSISLKTKRPGTRLDISGGWVFGIEDQRIRLIEPKSL